MANELYSEILHDLNVIQGEIKEIVKNKLNSVDAKNNFKNSITMIFRSSEFNLDKIVKNSDLPRTSTEGMCLKDLKTRVELMKVTIRRVEKSFIDGLIVNPDLDFNVYINEYLLEIEQLINTYKTTFSFAFQGSRAA